MFLCNSSSFCRSAALIFRARRYCSRDKVGSSLFACRYPRRLKCKKSATTKAAANSTLPTTMTAVTQGLDSDGLLDSVGVSGTEERAPRLLLCSDGIAEAETEVKKRPTERDPGTKISKRCQDTRERNLRCEPQELYLSHEVLKHAAAPFGATHRGEDMCNLKWLLKMGVYLFDSACLASSSEPGAILRRTGLTDEPINDICRTPDFHL
jgi:hypothetical protein